LKEEKTPGKIMLINI